MNSNMLKAKIIEKGYTQEAIAKMIGIGVNTFNLKINKKSDFGMREVADIQKILNLSDEEICDIFIRV